MNNKERKELHMGVILVEGAIIDLLPDINFGDQSGNQGKIRDAHYRESLGARRVLLALLHGKKPKSVLVEMKKMYVPSSGWLSQPCDPLDGLMGDL